jgi:hypothetical protein
MPDSHHIAGPWPLSGDPDSRRVRRTRIRRQRWQQVAVTVMIFLGMSLLVGAFVLGSPDPGGGALTTADATGPGSPTPGPDGRPTATPPAEPPPTEVTPVLMLTGQIPTSGPGTFRFATTRGGTLGTSGTLRRYRIALEEDIDEDLAGFARFVDETLGGEQGWTAGGQARFQRVPGDAAHDLTIYLVTSETARQMCATAGLVVVTPSLPTGGVSCYYAGRVVLNLHRWRQSVPDYVEQGVPLVGYRQMLVNHEVGHALGLGHEACPGPGEPAPVMQQQSISLAGCEAYAWPYLDGRRYTGPPR